MRFARSREHEYTAIVAVVWRRSADIYFNTNVVAPHCRRVQYDTAGTGPYRTLATVRPTIAAVCDEISAGIATSW